MGTMKLDGAWNGGQGWTLILLGTQQLEPWERETKWRDEALESEMAS